MDMREDMRPLAVAVVKVLQNISVSVVNTPLDKQSFALLCGGLCALQIHVPKARSAGHWQATNGSGYRSSAREREPGAAPSRPRSAGKGKRLFSSARERELPVRQGPPSRPDR